MNTFLLISSLFIIHSGNALLTDNYPCGNKLFFHSYEECMRHCKNTCESPIEAMCKKEILGWVGYCDPFIKFLNSSTNTSLIDYLTTNNITLLTTNVTSLLNNNYHCENIDYLVNLVIASGRVYGQKCLSTTSSDYYFDLNLEISVLYPSINLKLEGRISPNKSKLCTYNTVGGLFAEACLKIVKECIYLNVRFGFVWSPKEVEVLLGCK